MSAAELLKKMQKVREQRALRAMNASEQISKAGDSKIRQAQQQQQQQQNQQIDEINRNKQLQKMKDLLSSKQVNKNDVDSIRHNEKHDLMLNVPPSYTSPAHVVPQYRNSVSDPLCVPFHARSAVNLFLHQLVQQNGNMFRQSRQSKNNSKSNQCACEQNDDVQLTKSKNFQYYRRKRERANDDENDEIVSQCLVGNDVDVDNNSNNIKSNGFDEDATNNEMKVFTFLNVTDATHSLHSFQLQPSSLIDNYFSPYLAHKLNVEHYATSYKTETNTQQSQTQLRTFTRNGIQRVHIVQRQSKLLKSPQLMQKQVQGELQQVTKDILNSVKTPTSAQNILYDKLGWKSLYDDDNYLQSCISAAIRTHNFNAHPCADVNQYVRKDFIAHGVYGVVFSATKNVKAQRKRIVRNVALNNAIKMSRFMSGQQQKQINIQQQEDSRCKKQNRQSANVRNNKNTIISSSSSSSSSISSIGRSNINQLFAVKHIRKKRLGQSLEGFPTYLLRQFDLLLRVRHPNIVTAKQLVLLDPSPQLNLCYTCQQKCHTHQLQRNQSLILKHQQSLQQPSQNQQSTHRELLQTQEYAQTASQTENQYNDANIGEGKTISSVVTRSKNTVIGNSITTTNANGQVNDAAITTITTTGTAASPSSKLRDVFLIMQYCPFDLKRYMFYYSANVNPHLPSVPYLHISSHNKHPDAVHALISRIKSVIYQILRGLQFLHDHRILHRDLKTSNILLDRHGKIKLCDFGLSRHYREGQRLTPTVVTLLYRAPERHFGVIDYSHKLDSWSAGCIFAQLFLKQPLFKAQTDIAHLRSICDVIGIPTEETFPGLYKLPTAKEMMRGIGRWNRENKLAKVFATSTCRDAAYLPQGGLDLLNRLLEWNPAKRLSAKEALQHKFFKQFPPPCAPAQLLVPMPTLYSTIPKMLVTSKSNTIPVPQANDKCANQQQHQALQLTQQHFTKNNSNNNKNDELKHQIASNVDKEDQSSIQRGSQIQSYSNNVNNKTDIIYNGNGKWEDNVQPVRKKHSSQSYSPSEKKEDIQQQSNNILQSRNDDVSLKYSSPIEVRRDDGSHNSYNSLSVNNVLDKFDLNVNTNKDSDNNYYDWTNNAAATAIATANITLEKNNQLDNNTYQDDRQVGVNKRF